jgi:hypothetical protein
MDKAIDYELLAEIDVFMAWLHECRAAALRGHGLPMPPRRSEGVV